MFLGKGVLKICSKFTGEHPCWSAISIRHVFSPVKSLHIFRTPFLKNISGWLVVHLAFSWLIFLKFEQKSLPENSFQDLSIIEIYANVGLMFNISWSCYRPKHIQVCIINENISETSEYSGSQIILDEKKKKSEQETSSKCSYSNNRR